MTERSEDILGLKISADGLNPSSVRASDVALLIREFERLLLSNLKEEYPEIDTKDNVILAFDHVKDESIGIFLKEVFDNYEINKYLKFSLISLGLLLSKNQIDSINKESLSALNYIQAFSRKYQAKAEVKLNGETFFEIHNDIDLSLKQKTYSGHTLLVGELLDSGGERPNLHLKLESGEKIIINTDRDTAKLLGSKLYEVVALEGVAIWDAITDTIIKFELSNTTSYQAGSTYDAIQELKDLTSGYWDNFNTDEEINEALLR